MSEPGEVLDQRITIMPEPGRESDHREKLRGIMSELRGEKGLIEYLTNHVAGNLGEKCDYRELQSCQNPGEKGL
ncbi:hypothetical protein RRG08_059528 [Elysia crispata]|uniref:Uncharacterized protein n=1 Tax=Elysia crispata TaxID=231223 RepID=A0AAE1DC14_9GAST|nr:hypothetical protein RRG08_059528 [Elysia crispata]